MGIGDTASRPAVLVVTHNYPRYAEDQAGQFIQTLIHPVRDRYRFIVIAPHQAGLEEAETLEQVEIVRFRYGPDEQETLAYEGNMHEQVLASWRKRFLFLSFMRSMRKQVAAAIDHYQPVAAHVHWWIPGALATAGTLTRRKVPYVLTTHGSDLTLMQRFSALRPLGKGLFRRAAACTAVSSYLRDRLKELAGVEAHVLPMPYDDTKFMPQPPSDLTPARITCIGRLIERKGQRYLLEAEKLLKERGVASHIMLVGDGPDREMLTGRIQELGLADHVTMTGNVPHSDIPAIIRDSAVVVLPSVKDWKGEVEGLGMVLAEASACARPVIGTDLAGPKDAVADGESGILVAPNNAGELADALQRILTDRDLAARLGQGGVDFARRNFSPGSQAEKLAAIIESVRC